MKSGKQIRLKTSKKANDGNPFKSGSILEVVVAGTKQDPNWELLPVKAFDPEGLPYTLSGVKSCYSMELKDTEFEYLDKAEAFNKVSFSMTNSDSQEDENTFVSLALNEMYAEEPFKIDPDGRVKTSGKEDSEDCESEDKKKDETMEKEAEKQENRLTANDEDTSIDYDTSIPDSGKVKPEIYKEDSSSHLSEPPILGKINQLKTMAEKLKNSLSEDGNISTDMSTDTAGSGKTEDCYSEDTKEMPADKEKNFQFGEI